MSKVLGMGDSSDVDTSRSFKVKHVWRYLQNPQLDDDDLVVFFDAYDVLLFPAIRRVAKVLLLLLFLTPCVTLQLLLIYFRFF